MIHFPDPQGARPIENATSSLQKDSAGHAWPDITPDHRGQEHPIPHRPERFIPSRRPMAFEACGATAHLSREPLLKCRPPGLTC